MGGVDRDRELAGKGGWSKTQRETEREKEWLERWWGEGGGGGGGGSETERQRERETERQILGGIHVDRDRELAGEKGKMRERERKREIVRGSPERERRTKGGIY